jgi:hypothetical protein
MRLTFLVTFFVFSSSLVAQEWFPIGANWYYNQVDFLLMGERFKYFEVTGDTTIQGKYCHTIEGECECSEFALVNYLHVDGEQIFYFDEVSSAFRILYDFGLAPGDTLKYFSYNHGETQYVLDSITTLDINGYALRVQHFQYVNGIWELGDKVFEFIGSNRCLYPLIGVCDPGTGGLRCYEDGILGLYKFIDIDIPCDYKTTATVDLQQPSVKVYPSPAHDYFIIEAERPMSQLEVINIHSGSVLFQSTPVQHTARIDRRDFPAGTYLIRIRLDNDSVQYLKTVLMY